MRPPRPFHHGPSQVSSEMEQRPPFLPLQVSTLAFQLLHLKDNEMGAEDQASRQCPECRLMYSSVHQCRLMAGHKHWGGRAPHLLTGDLAEAYGRLLPAPRRLRGVQAPRDWVLVTLRFCAPCLLARKGRAGIRFLVAEQRPATDCGRVSNFSTLVP